jgi:HemY protein
VADGVISDRWAPVSPSGALDGFVWRTPDERLAAPTESAAPPPPEAIAAPVPAPVITPAPEAIAPEPRSEAVQGPAVVPVARTGVIIDPASMSPDDPGPQGPEAKRRGFRLYANE